MKLIFLLLLILTSCSTGYVITQPIIKEDIKEPDVYFCPQENCEDIFLNYINNAKQTIHCALFDLDLENIIYKFEEKSKSLDVKIVIDDENWDQKFSGKGIIQDTSSQFSHNKFCIFDNQIVWTGSMNPTNNGAYKNNNNIIIIQSKHLANNYELEFEELWNYNFGTGRKTYEPIVYLNNKKYENYFCPEDNCKQHVLDQLNQATESIYFMVFSFTDFDITNTLIQKSATLDVRGVLEAKRVNMQYNQYRNLIKGNIKITKDTNPYTMHHKVFIIDNQTVITGSYNPTKAGNENNDENILIIHNKEIANKFLEEFEELTN
jgi:phosphatidylserine/phosphatidylglycerophosphate/cardiolipin synthase-like enzyme